MEKKYDVVIVGGGPGGIFCALELKNKAPSKRVLIIERGKPVMKRHCPEKELGRCAKCKLCQITSGFSGAGAYSDGKLSLFNPDDKTFHVGGRLHEFIGVDETKSLIKYTDNIYLSFGATVEIYGGADSDFAKNMMVEAERFGLNLVAIPIRHLGTDWAHIVYERLQNHLLEIGVDIAFNTEVQDLIVSNNKVLGVKCLGKEGRQEVRAEQVVLAVGRAGAEWLEKLCDRHNIDAKNAPVDIGVRYELSDKVMKNVNASLYEAKIFGYSEFGDKVRTFCQNPSGMVSAEAYDDNLTLVNGHSAKETRTNNTNVSLLCSLDLNWVDNPIEAMRRIAKSVNQVGNGQVLVQRLGDLLSGTATTAEDLANNSIRPTLKSAVPGDLGACMPYRVIMDLLDFITRVDKIIPGFAYPGNLIYGPEAKFYSKQVTLASNFETSISGLYAIGDGCGLTRGLMMASASGVQLARNLTAI